METFRGAGDLENRQTDHMARKQFRCESEDHIIAKCPKPPKDNEKRQIQVCLKEKDNPECDNGKHNSDQIMHAYIARMSVNDECPGGNFGDSSQWTN